MAFFKKEDKQEYNKNLLKDEVEYENEGLLFNDPVYEKYKSEIDFLILEDEEVEEVHPLIIDYLCITNKRLIFVDKEVSGKVEIVSVPYRNICDISIVRGHALNITNELKVRTKGKDHELKFIKGRDITSIYNKIVSKII